MFDPRCLCGATDCPQCGDGPEPSKYQELYDWMQDKFSIELAEDEMDDIKAICDRM